MRDTTAGEFSVKSKNLQVFRDGLRQREKDSANENSQKIKRVPCHGFLKVP